MPFIALYLQVFYVWKVSTLVTKIPHVYGVQSFNTLFTNICSVDCILIELFHSAFLLLF